MTSTSGEANGNVPPSVVSATGSAAGGAGLYADFQATTRMLLEVQFSQQRLVERFLDTQERMLLHCLTGGASGVPALPASAPLTLSVAAPSAPAAVALASVAQPAVHHPVPQPVVPQPVIQQPALGQPIAPPSAFGSAAARVAPSGVVARPPVAVPSGNAATPAPPAAMPAAVVRPAAVVAPAPVAAPTANGHAHGAGTNGAAVASNGQASAVAKNAVPAAPSAAGGPPSVEQFREDLLAIVSERTGYPTDMLDVDLPLEAGLGIDSIKTVEIFSSLKTYHVYFADEGQDEEERLTEFTKLKTLGDIIDSYARRHAVHAAAGSGSTGNSAATAPALNGEAAKSSSDAAPSSVDRYSLTAVEAPLGANGSKKNFQSIT